MNPIALLAEMSEDPFAAKVLMSEDLESMMGVLNRHYWAALQREGLPGWRTPREEWTVEDDRPAVYWAVEVPRELVGMIVMNHPDGPHQAALRWKRKRKVHEQIKAEAANYAVQVRREIADLGPPETWKWKWQHDHFAYWQPQLEWVNSGGVERFLELLGDNIPDDTFISGSSFGAEARAAGSPDGRAPLWAVTPDFVLDVRVTMEACAIRELWAETVRAVWPQPPPKVAPCQVLCG